jgi:hypothetical protein
MPLSVISHACILHAEGIRSIFETNSSKALLT